MLPGKCLENPVNRYPPSPCNSVCRVEVLTGWCIGCKRTLEEIADWPMLTAHEKRLLLDKLPERQ